MQTRAAILWQPQTEWSVEDIELDPPKAGEVLVRLAASGLCHSDEHMVTGDFAVPADIAELMGINQFPLVGGHEGAGEVLEVGPGVTDLAVGDHVVFSFIPACGKCPSCRRGQSQVCDLGAFLLGGRQFTDQTSRHHSKDGTDLGTMAALGTFSPYTVVSTDSCVKIDPEIPLDKAALVGCGVTTGWGSAVYAADVQPGETVVVYGVGGIGTAAVQGASFAGARYVVVVEPVEWKREAIMQFGATHAVATHADAQLVVMDLTQGAMADKAILTVGLIEGSQIGELTSIIKKCGRAVVTAISPMMNEDVKLNLFDFAMQRKELVGCIFGNANPQVDIPKLLGLYKDGHLKLDEMVTTTYTLDEVNQGYQDMRDGKNFRGLILYPHDEQAPAS